MLKKVLLLAAALILVVYFGSDVIAVLATGDMRALKHIILRGGSLAPLISFALIIVQAFISPLPSVVIFMVNGVVFGKVFGFLISWLGSLCSALLCFGLIRYLDLKLNVSRKTLATVVKLIEDHQDQAVFIARILPVIPFDLASYAFALTAVDLRRFMIGTALGQTPAIFFYTFWSREARSWLLNLAGILFWMALVSLVYYGVKRKNPLLYLMKDKENE